MEKISGILSSSPRVSSVDLKSSLPVRPGVPSFGRPQGEVTQVRMDGRTTAEKAVAEHMKLQDKRRGEEFHSEIARDLSHQFFIQNSKDAQPAGAVSMPADMINTIGDSTATSPHLTLPESSRDDQLEATSRLMAHDDMDAPEVGRYLDVHA